MDNYNYSYAELYYIFNLELLKNRRGISWCTLTLSAFPWIIPLYDIRLVMYNNIFVKIIMMPINLYIKCFSTVLNFGYKYINFDNKKTYVVYLYSKCVSSSSMQLCPIATDFYPDFIYLIYQWSAPFSIQKKIQGIRLSFTFFFISTRQTTS